MLVAGSEQGEISGELGGGRVFQHEEEVLRGGGGVEALGEEEGGEEQEGEERQ